MTASIKENKKAANNLAEEVSVERARIDNLVASPTPGDSELVDIRVGADGVTYGSAGTAVREQLKGLSADMVSGFVKHGGSDLYVSNVEAYTDEYEHLLISDIRRNYDGAVGFSLFDSDATGKNYTLIRAVHNLAVVEKKVVVPFGTNSVLVFDFDVSILADGARYTGVGEKSVLKPSRLFSRVLYKEEEETPRHEFASIGLFENFGVVGDSFASGAVFREKEDGTFVGSDHYNMSWGQIVARTHGMECVNYSAGGLTTRTWLNANRGLPMLLSHEPNQLYVLALGINDTYALGSGYLGTINDITANYNDNPDSFYGNYGRIIEQIKNHAPDAKMILSTMATNTGTSAMFNAAILEIAEHYGIPCVKQYEDEFFNSVFYNGHMVQGHPISVVYSGMAKAMTRLIEETMVIHYGYFTRYVG